MTAETRCKLMEAYMLCKKEYRSIEYTIQFMMDSAEVSHAQAMNFLYTIKEDGI